MPRKGDGEKIDELEKLGATLLTRLDNLNKEVSAVYAAQKEIAQQLADLRREYERELALLKREVEDLKKWKDERAAGARRPNRPGAWPAANSASAAARRRGGSERGRRGRAVPACAGGW
jgi:peptidoglycan hydrolase CwlO-like protein